VVRLSDLYQKEPWLCPSHRQSDRTGARCMRAKGVQLTSGLGSRGCCCCCCHDDVDDDRSINHSTNQSVKCFTPEGDDDDDVRGVRAVRGARQGGAGQGFRDVRVCCAISLACSSTRTIHPPTSLTLGLRMRSVREDPCEMSSLVIELTKGRRM
jgi:hypothetical protein